MDPDLITGLAKLSASEHLPVSALVRRAIRRELEQAGVLASERLPKSSRAKRKGEKTI
jgi:Ribbon-helix-helix protein, copG family